MLLVYFSQKQHLHWRSVKIKRIFLYFKKICHFCSFKWVLVFIKSTGQWGLTPWHTSSNVKVFWGFEPSPSSSSTSRRPAPSVHSFCTVRGPYTTMTSHLYLSQWRQRWFRLTLKSARPRLDIFPNGILTNPVVIPQSPFSFSLSFLSLSTATTWLLFLFHTRGAVCEYDHV